MPIVWESNFRQIGQEGYLLAWELCQQKLVWRAYERSGLAISRSHVYRRQTHKNLFREQHVCYAA